MCKCMNINENITKQDFSLKGDSFDKRKDFVNDHIPEKRATKTK